MRPGRPVAPLPTPLLLAAACCAATLDAARIARIQALAKGTDWQLMLRLSRRHRIEALALRGLRAAAIALPDDVATTLRDRADQIAAQNLSSARMMAWLQQRFAAAGVDLLFIKGLTVGQLAYGNYLLKSGWDIDLLINEADVAASAELLLAEGFTCRIPGPDNAVAGAVRWHRTGKESLWVDAAGISIELHDALVDFPLLLPGIGMASPRQQVRLGDGLVFATLAAQQLYAYLCVHGSYSGWFRLKWLADLAALLSPLPPEDIAALHAFAARHGAGRASALALLLAARLFDLELGAPLAASLAADRRTLSLQRQVERVIGGRFMLDELTSTLWMHRLQFGLAEGLRAKSAQTNEELRRLRLQITMRLAGRRG